MMNTMMITMMMIIMTLDDADDHHHDYQQHRSWLPYVIIIMLAKLIAVMMPIYDADYADDEPRNNNHASHRDR